MKTKTFSELVEYLKQQSPVDEAIANSTSAEDDSLYNKYKNAFGVENFNIKL